MLRPNDELPKGSVNPESPSKRLHCSALTIDPHAQLQAGQPPSPFHRQTMLRWWPLALILVFATALRLHQLDARVMHGDEANQAVKTGHLLETGEYRFDPQDHHGPTLYYLTLPVAWLRGETTLAALTETTLRLVPLVAGVAAVALLAALAAPWGRTAACAAALLLATAPAAVYFSRYYIQESLLLAFTLGAFVAVRQWWRTGLTRWALLAGAAIGLMQATKASAPLFLLAGALALLAQLPLAGGSPTRRWRDVVLGLVMAIGVAALFYSSFFTHPAGLRDALATYLPAGGRVASGAGHEKPWHYYLGLFLPQTIGGYRWSQSLFLLLALAGATASIWAAPERRPLLRTWTLYTVVIAVLFSVVPYKTPWLVIHWLVGLSLLGGGLVGAVTDRRLRGRVLGLLLIGLTTAAQLRQTDLAVYLRPGDARNPLAYVHPSPDVRKVRPLVEQARAQGQAGPVRVISSEVWPLPWYLRGLDGVGYWAAPPDDCDGAVVVAAADQAEAVRARLRDRYRETFLGLRPGFVLVVFTREP